MKRSARQRARRLIAAFTLVELMVSIGIGGVAITAIYSIGAASTRQFQQEQQTASTQSSLRFAMHQVKSDISRAGYMASARADAAAPFGTRLCGGSISNALSVAFTGGSTGLISGISAFQNDVAGATSAPRSDTAATSGGLSVNVASGFTADRVLLVGNYETSHEYPIRVLSSTRIAISATSHGALSDFAWTNAGAAQATYSNDIARAFFPIGSLIRIQTSDQQHHFATISAAVTEVGGELVMDFGPGITPDCMATANNGFVAPLSVIRYHAEETPTTGGTAATIDAAPATRPNSQGSIAHLMRTEMQPDLKATPFAARPNRRYVLDFLAAFNLEFTLNGVTTNGQPDNYVIGGRTNIETAINPNPERVRSVFIELAARMPAIDNTMPWSATGCANLRCYQVSQPNGQPLSANFASRVRVLRGEVFVPNVAYEGY